MTETSTARTAAITATETVGAPEAPFTAELTADTIANRIGTGISFLAAAFTQMENRLIADNGKRYPIDATLPDGVEDTGSVELVNRYAFLERSLVSVVVWKLETLAHNGAERIEDQKAKIRNAVRDMQRGRCEERVVDALVAYLDTMEEQQAMIVAAYNEAIDQHAGILGEDYETRAMKAERRLTEQAKPGNAKLDALKARGLA